MARRLGYMNFGYSSARVFLTAKTIGRGGEEIEAREAVECG